MHSRNLSYEGCNSQPFLGLTILVSPTYIRLHMNIDDLLQSTRFSGSVFDVFLASALRLTPFVGIQG